MITRLTNNIKSNISKVICKNHFEDCDYMVEKSSIDSRLLNQAFKDKMKMGFTSIMTKQSLIKTPDYLMYNRGKDYINLFYVKAKYRSKVKSFDDLMLESYWEYRDFIFTDLFKHLVISQFKLDQKLFDDNKAFSKHKDKVKLIVDYYISLITVGNRDRELYVKNIILFYFVIKSVDCDITKEVYIDNDRIHHIYLSTTLSPKIIPLGDESILDIKYLSKSLDDSYRLRGIKEALNDIISN
jgi:hypothetical protein